MFTGANNAMKESETLEIMLNVLDPARISLIAGFTDLWKGINGVCFYINKLLQLTPLRWQYIYNLWQTCGQVQDADQEQGQACPCDDAIQRGQVQVANERLRGIERFSSETGGGVFKPKGKARHPCSAWMGCCLMSWRFIAISHARKTSRQGKNSDISELNQILCLS